VWGARAPTQCPVLVLVSWKCWSPYRSFADVQYAVRVVTLDEIKAEDWTLNISRYVLPPLQENIPPLPDAIAAFKDALNIGESAVELSQSGIFPDRTNDKKPDLS
jgi:hypothetical protein